jgi:hypothetical protein
MRRFLRPTLRRPVPRRRPAMFHLLARDSDEASFFGEEVILGAVP